MDPGSVHLAASPFLASWLSFSWLLLHGHKTTAPGIKITFKAGKRRKRVAPRGSPHLSILKESKIFLREAVKQQHTYVYVSLAELALPVCKKT
jgi:hypothetical protein